MKKGILLLLFIAGFSWNAVALNCIGKVENIGVNINLTTGSSFTYVCMNITSPTTMFSCQKLINNDTEPQNLASIKMSLALSAKNLGKQLLLQFDPNLGITTCDTNLNYEGYPQAVQLTNSN